MDGGEIYVDTTLCGIIDSSGLDPGDMYDRWLEFNCAL